MRWVADSTDARWLRFEDVALEVLAGELRDDARAFIARELGELNEDSSRAGRLRETLQAYFVSGHNAAAAAAALGIHQQTVGNRLKAIEDQLGASVGSRRAELETALRLRRCFGSAPEMQAGLQNEGYLP
jgi:DNA-binding PucR family transcriptional regulator